MHIDRAIKIAATEIGTEGEIRIETGEGARVEREERKRTVDHRDGGMIDGIVDRPRWMNERKRQVELGYAQREITDV